MDRIMMILMVVFAMVNHIVGQSLTSVLGTLEADLLPQWLSGSNGDPHNPPWGNIYPGGPPPNTGVTRHYNFTIMRANKAPDGYVKNMILINDQFPGPLIEANWGDEISVTVTNMIEPEMEEGTSLHWHGLSQQKTPWYDGVPGVSQCPIAPGKTFTYTFQADTYGTSWYHSHYSSQYNDGLYGPLIIHGPVQPGAEYDYDLGPVMLSDYTHQNYHDVLQRSFAVPSIFPNVDNNLINGKGIFDCGPSSDGNCVKGTGVAQFRVHSGKKYRLRLINAGGASSQKFSIDGHPLTVIANDFVPVEPYMTNVVTLGIGQRTDVILTASGSPTDLMWMRSDIDNDCLNLTSTHLNATGIIYYENADHSAALPTTSPYPWESNGCRNDPLSRTVPYYPLAPPESPSTTQIVNIVFKANATGHVIFFVDGSSFRTNYNYPILLLTNRGNTSYPHSPEWNVYDFGSNSSVRVIMQNTFQMQHPIHLHGQNFFVLAEGYGNWDGIIVNERNPQRRDTHILAPGTPTNISYVVLEWIQDNPGIWPLHCHISLHVSDGLYLNVMAQPQKVKSEMQIPSVVAQTCRDWWAFTGHEVVDQIDSGL